MKNAKLLRLKLRTEGSPTLFEKMASISRTLSLKQSIPNSIIYVSVTKIATLGCVNAYWVMTKVHSYTRWQFLSANL